VGAIALPVFPGLPQSIYTITLAGTRFRVRLTWRERTASWYLDLLAQDGTRIVSGRRLVAKGMPLVGLLPEGGPDGQFYVDAVNITRREQLGADAFLLFYPTADLPTQTQLDEGFRVVVP
jgi:hypothetical protein